MLKVDNSDTRITLTLLVSLIINFDYAVLINVDLFLPTLGMYFLSTL